VTTTPPNGAARPGRPRSTSADDAILEAAVEVLGERGFAGLTTSEVIERSGVARATVYRRYPTRDALVLAAASAIKGRDPYPLTGDIARDLRTGAHSAAAIIATPRFQQFLPALVAEATRSPDLARTVITRIAPNHFNVIDQYTRTAREAGMRTDIDPELVPTMLIGSILYRFMSTGIAPYDAFADQVVDVLVRGLQEAPPDSDS
jgi:AcrR family transcriptional regulator